MKNVLVKIVLPLAAIVTMLGGLMWLSPIQSQQAAWQVPHTQSYPCGGITVNVALGSATTCDSNGYNHSMTSYNASVDISATGSNLSSYTIHSGWNAFWCSTEDPHAPCLSNEVARTNTFTASGNTVTVSAPTMSPQGQYAGLACGYYQDDFGFYVTNSSGQTVCNANINLSNLGSTNNNASWCHTGTTCSVPTPTSTPTPRLTPTSTPTPGITITPTATPTPTDCDGDYDNSPESDCVTPTATTTPTNAPTATPTPVSGNNNCTGDSCNNNQQQQQQQTQNNNQTVNITLGNQQQQQQEVLAATAPTQLPSTGAGSDVVFGLLALIPVGWKIRKLI